MKALLLSGLLVASPFIGHAQFSITNNLQNLEQQLWNDLSSLIQLYTDSNNMNAVNQQINRVIQDQNQINNQLSNPRLVHRSGLKHFPIPNSNPPSNSNGWQGSGNWAGYIDTPSSNAVPYSSISGTWTVPSITGSKQSVAAQWIGLGGVSTQALLQMGTVEDFEQGNAVASVFWEQLPQTAQTIMTVPIGSTFHGSIIENSDSSWSISFTATEPNGQNITKTIPVTLDSSYSQAIGSSAEWISEDPSDAYDQLLPLANMGTINYSDALVNGQALNAAGNLAYPVALVSGSGQVLIAPSPINSDEKSFSTQMQTTRNNGSSNIQHAAQRRNVHKTHVFQDGEEPYNYSW